LVLTGAGRGFCAGGDLNALARGDSPPEAGTVGAGSTDAKSLRARAASIRSMERTTELLHEMPKVTIAAINGPCAGAGISWACAADLRVAARSAIFTAAFLRAGQSGDYGATWLLPRIVGMAKARELLLLSGRIDAVEAARIGLVNEVVDDDALPARIDEITATVAGFAPNAVAALKANLTDGEQGTLSASLAAEARRMVETAQHGDAHEALAAYREGRPPRFTGEEGR
jgi:2-(1,2-epoxy-1,2-dihydrophenyl)acetyl-CoA isomerase